MTDHAIITKIHNLYKPETDVVHQAQKNSESVKLLSTDTINRISFKMELIFITSPPEIVSLFDLLNILIINYLAISVVRRTVQAPVQLSEPITCQRTAIG